MVGPTPKAGAAPSRDGGSGCPAEPYAPLARIIGQSEDAIPKGIALKLDAATDRFHLVLLDADNMPLLALGSYPEEEVVAEWRALAASSGLALKIQLPNGSVMTPYPQVGRVQLGTVRIRRRHGLLSGRRPRFLTRRKTGRFEARPQVYREAAIFDGREA